MAEQVLHGRTALITGAGAGIGRACAVALARAGATVVVTDADADAADSTAHTLRSEGARATALRADVTRPDEVAEAVEYTVREFGRLDCAVNNAGVTSAPADTADIARTDLERILAVNVTGLWQCMQHELKSMVETGGGTIVNQSSSLGMVGVRGSAAYAASKHAVLGLTRSTALEYIERGIRVNAVCAGPVRTAMFDRFLGDDPEAAAGLRAASPIGRFAEPEEVAEAVLWLSSPLSSYVVGHGLVVDGGWSTQ
ncbi:glucose 1-dehydrogenase [Nocardia sp. NPDC019395]|uniref:SDR family NAD(P)-dependent oxidoreductase n=1 Tax=Nocardia sp. NPDC019395 TaxID=3154686 RepID=UPI0033CAC623